MITYTSKIRAYFAPLISETGFAGILATVNGQKLISLFCAERPQYSYGKYRNSIHFYNYSFIFSSRLFSTTAFLMFFSSSLAKMKSVSLSLSERMTSELCPCQSFSP